MFSQLKETFSVAADRLRTLGNDEADNAIGELVSKGTADVLISPDWSINISICDLVNQNANPSVMYEKLLKTLRRSMSKNNAKCQILTLTILETCVKNGYPVIYSSLAKSELWLDLTKMAGSSLVDAEVRDKILILIEDYAKVLPPAEFKATYESLLERGVDFPVRGENEQPPILTPPSIIAPAAAAAVPAVIGGTQGGYAMVDTTAFAGLPVGIPTYAPQQMPVGQPGGDPFAGMSQEDRAAVQAAMAEMAAEDSARQSAAFAASTAMFQQMDQQQATAGGREGGTHVSPLLTPPQQTPAPPALPGNAAEALEVVANATSLLNEMLSSQTDPREQFMSELGEQCVGMRSQLEEMLLTLSDETLMNSALVHHEALQAVITKYAEHLAQVVQGGGLSAVPSVPGQQQSPEGLAAPQLGLATVAAGPNFSLLGEEEEEGEQVLSSKRAPVAHPDVSHDLIDMESGASAPVAPSSVADPKVEATHGTADQQLL